jgi:hypothetical protein
MKKNSQDRPLSDRIGNAVEKLGHKIADAGAPKVGQKIHDLGDKMEKRHSNPKHPHKT